MSFSEEPGEGELFYRAYISRQNSLNNLEDLVKKEQTDKLDGPPNPSNRGNVKDQENEKEKLIPDANEKTRKKKKKKSKPILTVKRIVLVSGFLAVCAALGQIFGSAEDRSKLMGIMYCLFFLGALDLVVVGRTAGRWLWLHAAGNMVVAVTAAPDLYKTFRDPLRAFEGEPSLYPILMIPAIHLYHLFCFHCSKADWVHHVVFAGIICPMGLFLKTGPIANAVAFFICGLPGGLDYIMLALVKHGYLSRLREKVWNARINVWIRSTGLVFCAATIYVGCVAGGETPGVAAAIGALLCVVNGQYYMQVVVGNTFVRTREEKGAVAYNS